MTKSSPPPRIVLSAHAEPAAWPVDALCDVVFRLVLTNEGDREVAVYPLAARLSDMITSAGVGISWQLRFSGPNGPVPQQELRTYFGPPGNPPSPSAVKSSTEVRLR